MQRGEGGGDDDELVPVLSLGPVRRRMYEPNPKHASFALGRVSREPRNGQEALDFSVSVKPTSRLRVGVDYGDALFVVLRFHDLGEFRDSANYEIFHGYVVDWRDLTQEQRNALMRWGFANLRGRIT